MRRLYCGINTTAALLLSSTVLAAEPTVVTLNEAALDGVSAGMVGATSATSAIAQARGLSLTSTNGKTFTVAPPGDDGSSFEASAAFASGRSASVTFGDDKSSDVDVEVTTAGDGVTLFDHTIAVHNRSDLINFKGEARLTIQGLYDPRSVFGPR